MTQTDYLKKSGRWVSEDESNNHDCKASSNDGCTICEQFTSQQVALVLNTSGHFNDYDEDTERNESDGGAYCY